MNWGGSSRKYRVNDQIVRPHLNYSCRMSNPGVSDISVGGCGEVGLQKLKLSLKLLLILLFRLSFLVRMFLEVLIDFRVEGGEHSEHTLGDHRILDFCEPKIELLFPESRFNSFGWL